MKKLFSIILLFATMLTFTACGSDKENKKDEPVVPTLSQFDYTLYSGDKVALKGDGLKNLSWFGDTFVAEVDDQGVLRANKIGYTSITSEDISGRNSILAVVKPKIMSYSEPLLYWQGVGSQIVYKDGYIQFEPDETGVMPRSDIWGISDGFLIYNIKIRCDLPWEVQSQTSEGIMFKTDKAASPFVAYTFENGKVSGAGVCIDPNQCADLPDFLNERYLVYDVNMSTYEAHFAHAYTGFASHEVYVDYVGVMQYSSSLNYVVLTYVQSETRSQATAEYIMNTLLNLSVNE